MLEWRLPAWPTLPLSVLAGWLAWCMWRRQDWLTSRQGRGKLGGVRDWVVATPAQLLNTARDVLSALGCDPETAEEMAQHLVEANLLGVDSHGVVRLEQYAEQVDCGLVVPSGRPCLTRAPGGGCLVDGGGGFGIPALRVAVEAGLQLLAETEGGGAAVVGVVNCGHTGRLGQFVELAAERGALCILCGGGSRRCWRQVAPHGGAAGLHISY